MPKSIDMLKYFARRRAVLGAIHPPMFPMQPDGAMRSEIPFHICEAN